MLVLVVVVVVVLVLVAADVEALLEEAAATAAGAELELSPRATNNAAPTTPIATAVPTLIPEAAPALADDDSDWAKEAFMGETHIANAHSFTKVFLILLNLLFIKIVISFYYILPEFILKLIVKIVIT